MNLPQITATLKEIFGETVQFQAPDAWQVETSQSRLLVLLSEDGTWLRVLIPIASATEALPFAEQLLSANFDFTLETRYAIHEGVLWGVFQHSLSSLTTDDFKIAITHLQELHQIGLNSSFSQQIEAQIRLIIQAAKEQGQSIDATLQTLERFYEEGVMGELDQTAGERDQVLKTWRYQLERLWNEQ